MAKKKNRKIKRVNKIKKAAEVKEKPRAVNFLAPEFVYFRKGFGWYLAISLIGLGLIAVAVWLRFWLFGAVIALSLLVFFQYSHKRPQSRECQVSKEGVKIGEKFFPLSNFKSFSIVFDQPVSHLFLETAKRFQPSFWLHFKVKDLLRIRKSLLEILPEKPIHHEAIIARINRWIRF